MMTAAASFTRIPGTAKLTQIFHCNLPGAHEVISTPSREIISQLVEIFTSLSCHFLGLFC
jgi:hypothetical protein